MPWYVYLAILWVVLSFPIGVFVGRCFAVRPVPNEVFDDFFESKAKAEGPVYELEIGIDEHLPTSELTPGVWVEVEIQNECGYGCKIYEHSKTHRRALAHNAAYGCRRSFNLIKE